MDPSVVYLLGGVLREFGEVERNEVKGQHVGLKWVNYPGVARSLSQRMFAQMLVGNVGSGCALEGIHAAASASCSLCPLQTPDFSPLT